MGRRPGPARLEGAHNGVGKGRGHMHLLRLVEDLAAKGRFAGVNVADKDKVEMFTFVALLAHTCSESQRIFLGVRFRPGRGLWCIELLGLCIIHRRICRRDRRVLPRRLLPRRESFRPWCCASLLLGCFRFHMGLGGLLLRGLLYHRLFRGYFLGSCLLRLLFCLFLCGLRSGRAECARGGVGNAQHAWVPSVANRQRSSAHLLLCLSCCRLGTCFRFLDCSHWRGCHRLIGRAVATARGGRGCHRRQGSTMPSVVWRHCS